MIVPKIPFNECERQKEVEKYQILDTLAETSYDDITSLIGFITDSPIAFITLLDNDRNYIKSNYGFSVKESPRALSFCGHAINQEDVLIVEDAGKDARFKDNPLVIEHQLIFYAGAPLVNTEGYKLGTLCVYDHKPKTMSQAQIDALKALAKQVVNLFELRLQNIRLRASQSLVENRNKELIKFANVVSHDLKSPLANIISLTELLEQENHNTLSEDSQTYLDYLKSSSKSLKDYIDGILAYYKNDDLLKFDKETISFNSLMHETQKIAIPSDDNISFTSTENAGDLTINKSAILRILVNLVTNAVKYNDKDTIKISVNLEESETDYLFTVEDNGRGIAEDKIGTIFDLFTTEGVKDRMGNLGTGIGLASVKKLIENQDGKIQIDSTPSVGSRFKFNIPK
ncbi:GAF domain-containing sensor histidine kinase [Lacinutrix neustonica]|uniref:histidine kinase n=1 Tax=Lacinutrix neustonica TaxID=2980107 RepID=A0A9E8MWI9_9FLAO|nr:GAF domain-containing sensor histidine kinase [Lacinutrix neustonica]WAC02229.1 GAF domain-containing sensor histidine kinase [Lacinutrix neustonica]